MESNLLESFTFLEGELEEDIYMECSEGLEEADNSEDCLKLTKSIYGLVQSARQFWKRIVRDLEDIGFKPSAADPCLLARKDKRGLVIIALYVDDCLCIGNKEAIESLINELQAKKLNLKIDRDFISPKKKEARFYSNPIFLRAWRRNLAKKSKICRATRPRAHQDKALREIPTVQP